MLQVALSGGEVRVVEVPEPVVRPGTLLVRTSHSLISAGTESASLGSGGRRENLVLKAIRNPALVRRWSSGWRATACAAPPSWCARASRPKCRPATRARAS